MFLTGQKLDLASVIQKVQSQKWGAIVTFSGCVRDQEEEKNIRSITYQSYEEMAVKELNKIVDEAQKKWPVQIALEHRIGQVPVGEASIVIASAGAHRKEAFESCQYVIDELKAKAQIWKVRFE